MTLESKAATFAATAHLGQKRKYTGEDYIFHPAAVAALVRSVPHTDEMLAAAWLHDVVEDTPIRIAEIHVTFGPLVARLVADLTDISKLADGNRKARKELDLAHTAKATPEAKTIKLADLIDNTRSIVDGDPKFAKVFLAEKKALLGVLKEGDPILYARAEEELL